VCPSVQGTESLCLEGLLKAPAGSVARATGRVGWAATPFVCGVKPDGSEERGGRRPPQKLEMEAEASLS